MDGPGLVLGVLLCLALGALVGTGFYLAYRKPGGRR
jgi:hypothetical protein